MNWRDVLKSLFALTLLLKFLLCFGMITLVVLFCAQSVFQWKLRCPYWKVGILLLPAMVLSIILRWKILNKSIQNWHQWVFYIESLFTLGVAKVYFVTPMHDIALAYFSSHGRFGCYTLDSSERCIYLLNDATLPLLLFIPPMIIGIIYFWDASCKKHSKSTG